LVTDKPRVLIIDDDEDSRIIYPIALKDAGIEADVAASGAEAIAMVSSVRPELILLDLAMPKMNGFQVLEKLRSNDQTADLPVVAFTASTLRYTETELKQKGFTSVLFKPIDPRALVMFVEHLLTRRAEGAPEA
jgi:CheY-like chemotaxis protein